MEKHAREIGKEYEEKYMQNDDRNLIEYIQKNIGNSADNMALVKGFRDVGGSSTASLKFIFLIVKIDPKKLKHQILQI